MHWRDQISKIEIISETPKSKKSKSNVQAFCVNVIDIDIPQSISDEIDNSEQISLRASLYDFKSKEFYGKQWTSSEFRLNNNSKINIEERMYFLTSKIEESVALVIEIVCRKLMNHEIHERSLGWTVFSLFKSSSAVVDLSSSDESETVNLNTYKGTIRALPLLTDPVEKNELVKIIDKCTLSLQLFTHSQFKVCQCLLPENFLLHESENLPGIKTTKSSTYNENNDDDDDYFDKFENPELAEFTDFTIENMNIEIEPSLGDFETELLRDITAEKHMREKTETPASGTQKRDSLNPVGQLKIVERRLRVGVHNGYQYTEENDIIHLKRPSENSSDKKRHSIASGNSLFAKNAVHVMLPPSDDNFVLVFILEYVVAENNERFNKTGVAPSVQHPYQLRWAIWGPSSAHSPHESTDPFISGVALNIQLSGCNVKAGNQYMPESRMFYKPNMHTVQVNKEGVEETIEENVNVLLAASIKLTPATDNEESMKMRKVFHTETPFDTLNEDVTDPAKTEYSRPVKPKKQQKQQKPQKPPQPDRRSKTQHYDEDDMLVARQNTLQHASFPQQQLPGYQMQPYPPTMYPYFTPMWPPISIDRRLENVSEYGGLEPYVVPYRGNKDGYDDDEEMKYQPTARGVNTTPGVRPIQLKSHSGLGLSRAKYSRLFSAGFPEIKDANGDFPFVVEPNERNYNDGPPINLDLEEKDHRSCNEIVFQFMAFSKFNEGHMQQQTKESSIYFTFQFYRYPVISTERLYLDRIKDQLSDHDSSTTYVLRHFDSQNNPDKKGEPGSMLKYLLDPGFMKPGDSYSFLEYMSQQTLHIDVWDGESLMLLGSCGVSLRNLLRQGKSAVQVAYELDVLNQNEIEAEGYSELKGRLHLRLANLGSVPTQVSNMRINPLPRKGALIDAAEPDMLRSLSMRSTQKPTSVDLVNGHYQITAVSPTLGLSGIVVRPQPAENSSRELATMLSSIQPDNSTNNHHNHNGRSSTIKTHEEDRKLEKYRTIVSQLNSGDDLDEKIILQSHKNEKVDKARKLRTIEIYRKQEKGDVIKKILSGVIQKNVNLFPKFGITELFEVKIKNHFNEDHNIQIEINQDWNYLSPVVHPNELRALKALYNVTTPSEDGLLSFNKKSGFHEVFVRSKESVIIPFKFVNLFCPNFQNNVEPQSSSKPTPVQNTSKMNLDEIECLVNFRTVSPTQSSKTDKDPSKLVSTIRVIAAPQPALLDQSFRFFHPEQSFLKRMIRLPPVSINGVSGDSSIVPVVRCSDPEVLVECRKVPLGTPNDVLLKVPCGPAPMSRHFQVAVYLDRFGVQPVQVWGCSVHSQARVDVVAHQGQATRIQLVMGRASGSGSRRSKLFSSHPNELMVGDSGPGDFFTLTEHSSYELTMNLTPLKVGNRNFQVNVVDIDNHSLIKSWIICAICREPDVTKMFEVQIPIATGTNNSAVAARKKISFTNPYSYARTYYIGTDRPDLLTFTESVLKIGPSDCENIGIIFYPAQQRCKQKIYVFVNDEDGKNEETLCLIISYI